jgi:hypothetical protein
MRFPNLINIGESEMSQRLNNDLRKLIPLEKQVT